MLRDDFSDIEIAVLDNLSNVQDPEVGFDIVSLGLIYDVRHMGEGHVVVTMTLSTKACPMHDLMLSWAEEATLNSEGVSTCDIDLVWEPEWSIDMANDLVKRELGAF